jgi:hypothetical protein
MDVFVDIYVEGVVVVVIDNLLLELLLIYPDHKVLNVPLSDDVFDEPLIFYNENLLIFFYTFRKMKATRVLGILFNKATDNIPLSASLTDVRMYDHI